MKKRLTVALATSLGVLICARAGAAQAAQETVPAQWQAIRAQMDAALRDAPSLSVVAISGGKIVWTDCEGWADIAARTPATLDTVYRVGSVSKSITATVAMIAERNRDVALADAITRYLPKFAQRSRGRFRSVSLQALLNMNAGLVQAVHYRGSANDLPGLDATRFVAQYALAPMCADNRYAYSNMGPELVARAISARTGQSFEHYARRTLLGPLAMTATYFASSDVPPAVLAKSYRGLTLIDYPYETDPVSGAGYLVSPRDLATYALFHLTGRAADQSAPLDQAALAALHRPAAGSFYSYGWGTIGSGEFRALISDGQVNGGQVTILLVPERGLGAIVMANSATDAVNQIAMATIEAMAPGFSASFDAAAQVLGREHEQAIKPLLPDTGTWRAKGSLTVDNKALRLALSNSPVGIAVSIDAAPTVMGKPLESDEGFARWSIACPSVLPACRDGTKAEAVLSLTRSEHGLGGMIAVESRLGLFPYEVDVVSQ